MASIFDAARESRTLAKPKSVRGPRYPLFHSMELLPTTEQKSLAEKYLTGYPCTTKAGRPRAIHSRDRAGKCIFCGNVDGALERPLGETAH